MPKTSTKWLTADEREAWKHFMLMQHQLLALLGRELAADGLSYQDYAVLATLSDEPGEQMRLVELGDTLGWEKSRVSHHTTRMEHRGLVARVKCPTDQRGWFLALTDAGRSASRAAAPHHVSVVRKHFIDLLTSDQIEMLDSISRTVLDNLTTD